PRPYSNIQVDSIRIIAEQNNAHFLLAAIPDLLSGTTSVKQVPYLFDSLQYYQSPVPVEDYNKEDGHFTDDGHLKYANFIQHLVDSLLSRGTKPQ
ncbi:MAG: hypothetical protein JWO06_2792, partial [Bacteroidota bacterium]|nr:hypothetical protein [Bacteroidota bacterium]